MLTLTPEEKIRLEKIEETFGCGLERNGDGASGIEYGKQAQIIDFLIAKGFRTTLMEGHKCFVIAYKKGRYFVRWWIPTLPQVERILKFANKQK